MSPLLSTPADMHVYIYKYIYFSSYMHSYIDTLGGVVVEYGVGSTGPVNDALIDIHLHFLYFHINISQLHMNGSMYKHISHKNISIRKYAFTYINDLLIYTHLRLMHKKNKLGFK